MITETNISDKKARAAFSNLIAATSSSSKVEPTYEQIVKDEIWVVYNLLSAEECKLLIDIAEENGFEDALITLPVGEEKYNKDIRDSKRACVSDEDIASYLTSRCKDFIPAAAEGGLLLALSEKLKYLKYDTPGAKFEQHYDACCYKSPTERSVFSMQWYLNDGMEGGQTTFFNERFKEGEYHHVPVRGSCLFFRQKGWLHEGSELKKGIKYTIRTEMMYKWFTPEEVDKVEHIKCNKCGAMTQFAKATLEDNPFLRCKCTPLNCMSCKRGHCKYCLEVIGYQEDKTLSGS